MRNIRNKSLAIVGALALAPMVFGNSITGTQTLNPRPGPIGKLQVVTPTVTLTHTGTTFSSFTGSEILNFKIRTTISTGSGSITVRGTADFTGSGPKIASGDFTYTCSGATFGTVCSGAQILTTGSQSNVLTVGAGVCVGTGCAGTDPSVVTTNFIVADSPVFKTGAFSATLTYTISGL